MRGSAESFVCSRGLELGHRNLREDGSSVSFYNCWVELFSGRRFLKNTVLVLPVQDAELKSMSHT